MHSSKLNTLREFITEEVRYLIYEYKYLQNLNEATQTITRQDAINMIVGTKQKGTIFTVTFIKKDGSKRVLTGRLGVKRYLKGGSLPYDPVEKGLIPVYDMQKQAYRMLNANTILSLKIRDNVYIVK